MSSCVKRHFTAADAADGNLQQRQRKHADQRCCLALASPVPQSPLLFGAAATAEQRAFLYRHVQLLSFRDEVDSSASITVSVNSYWRAAVFDAAFRCGFPSARTLECMCTFVDALYQPDFEAEFERRLQRLRDDYADTLFHMLGWQHPPKESFNRFLLERLMALHMVADTDSDATNTRDYLDSPLPLSVAAATAFLQAPPSSMASEIFEDLPAKIHPAWTFVATAAQASERIGKYVRAAVRLLTRHRDACLRGAMQSALDELGAIATRLSDLSATTASAAMSKSDDASANEFSTSVDEAVRLETQCTANFINAFRAPIDALCKRMVQKTHRQAEELLKISPLCRCKEVAVAARTGGASELSFCAELDSSTGHARIRAISMHDAEEHETVAVGHFLKLARQYQMHHLLADVPTTAANKFPSASAAAFLPASTVDSFEAASSDPLFLRAAFVLLRRYRTVCGTERGAASGGGFHAAIPRAVLDAMNAHFGVALECFASPLNAYFPHYCSANPALEAAFGSIGSFFATPFVTGGFVANPPFAWALMDAMFARIDKMLVASEQSTSVDGEPLARPLTFVIVVPHWVCAFILL
jgi:hypothetical protein